MCNEQTVPDLTISDEIFGHGPILVGPLSPMLYLFPHIYHGFSLYHKNYDLAE